MSYQIRNLMNRLQVSVPVGLAPVIAESIHNILLKSSLNEEDLKILVEHLTPNQKSPNKYLFSDKDIANQPFPIAYNMKMYNEAGYPLLRLLRLFDVAEILLRWKTSILLSLITHSKSSLPTTLAKAIAPSLLRPSFGLWNLVLRLTIEKVGANQLSWEVDQKFPNNTRIQDKANNGIGVLDSIISDRNVIAHGSIPNSIELDVLIEENYNKLKTIFADETKICARKEKTLKQNPFQFYAVYDNKAYHFKGSTLSTCKPPKSLQTTTNGIYIYTHDDLIIPVKELFVLPDDVNLAFEDQPFPVASYFSSKGSLRSNGDGELHYIVINGGQEYHKQELTDFIKMFQTNIKLPPNELWKKRFEEAKVIHKEAWAADIAVVRKWVKSKKMFDKDQNTPHIGWFGGKKGIGRSTLLMGSLGELMEPKKRSFVFFHRFENSGYRATDPSQWEESEHLRKFMRSLRDAISVWNAGEDEFHEIESTLVGEELLQDIKERLNKLLKKHQKKEKYTNIPFVHIGLDDVHYLNVTETNWLRDILRRLKHEIINPNQDNNHSHQVIVLMTGYSIAGTTHGKSKTQKDHDDLFSNTADSNCQWVFAWFLQNDPESIISGMAKEYRERLSYILKYLQGNTSDQGAQMAPMNIVSVRNILRMQSKNQDLLSNDNHPFFTSALERANGFPIFVHNTALNIKEGSQDINQPLPQNISVLDSYLKDGPNNDLISDSNRTLALLICLIVVLQRPLDTVTLQMLHDRTLQPDKERELLISRAIQSAIDLFSKISLHEKDADGNLLFGWFIPDEDLRNELNEYPLLQYTMVEAKEIVAYFKTNYEKIDPTTRLKKVFLERRLNPQSIQKISKPNSYSLEDVLTLLQNVDENQLISMVQMKNASGVELLQFHLPLSLCCTIYWSPHLGLISKLHVLGSKHSLHKEAKEYVSQTNDHWLIRINPNTLHPIDDRKHLLMNTYLRQKPHQIYPIKNDVFILTTQNSDDLTITSLQVFHHQHNRPLYSFAIDKALQQVVVHIRNGGKNIELYTAVDATVQKYELIHQNDTYTIQNYETSYVYGRQQKNKIIDMFLLDDETLVVYGGHIHSEGKKKYFVAECIDIKTMTHKRDTDKAEISWFIPKGRAKPKKDFFLVSTQSHWVWVVGGHVQLYNASQSTAVAAGTLQKSYSQIRKENGIMIVQKASKDKNNSMHGDVISIEETKSNHQLHVSKILEGSHGFSPTGLIALDNHFITLNHNSTISIRTLSDFKTHHQIEVEGATDMCLCKETLAIYGQHGFIATIDVEDLIQKKGTPKQFPTLHFGHMNGMTSIPFGRLDKEFQERIKKRRKKERKTPLQITDSLLLSYSEDNDIRLWTIDGDCLGLYRYHENKVDQLFLAKDYFVSFDIFRNVVVWNFGVGGCIENQNAVQPLDFVNDVVRHQKNIYSIHGSGEIYKWTDTNLDYKKQNVNTKALSLNTSTTTHIDTTLRIDHTLFLWSRSERTCYRLNLRKLSDSDYLKQKGSEEILQYDGMTKMMSDNSDGYIVGYTKLHPETSSGSIDIIASDGTIVANYQHTDEIVRVDLGPTNSVLISGKRAKTDQLIHQLKIQSPTKKTKKGASNKKIKLLHSELLCVNNRAGFSGSHLLNSGRLLAWYIGSKGITIWLKSDDKTHTVKIQGYSGKPRAFCEPEESPEQEILFHQPETSTRWKLYLDQIPETKESEDGELIEEVEENSDGTTYIKTKDVLKIEPIHAVDAALEHHDVIHSTSNLPSQFRIEKGGTQAFVEPMLHGIHLYLKTSSDSKVVVWLGAGMKGYKVRRLEESGKIIALKNREVILLQLMRGSKAIAVDGTEI